MGRDKTHIFASALEENPDSGILISTGSTIGFILVLVGFSRNLQNRGRTRLKIFCEALIGAIRLKIDSGQSKMPTNLSSGLNPRTDITDSPILRVPGPGKLFGQDFLTLSGIPIDTLRIPRTKTTVALSSSRTVALI